MDLDMKNIMGMGMGKGWKCKILIKSWKLLVFPIFDQVKTGRVTGTNLDCFPVFELHIFISLFESIFNSKLLIEIF